jgi:hypothetical protein
LEEFLQKIAFGDRRSEARVMSRRRRGLPPALALRLQVVRGALTGAMTIERGAKRLKMPPAELQKLVEGARQAVIAALGEDALVTASHR